MTSDCIEWGGYRSPTGYGKAMVRDGPMRRCVRAHRLAWERVNGPVPDGMFVLHRCDNRACVNVDHLFLGSQADNMRDKVSKRRQQRGERVPTSKLSAKDVDMVREHLRRGFSQADLARFLNVHQSTISHIATGATWRDDHPSNGI